MRHCKPLTCCRRSPPCSVVALSECRTQVGSMRGKTSATRASRLQLCAWVAVRYRRYALLRTFSGWVVCISSGGQFAAARRRGQNHSVLPVPAQSCPCSGQLIGRNEGLQSYWDGAIKPGQSPSRWPLNVYAAADFDWPTQLDVEMESVPEWKPFTVSSA